MRTLFTPYTSCRRTKGVNCLSQQLDGLHDEYLMQSSGLRLPIEDPHRFIAKVLSGADFFTAKVKEALGMDFLSYPHSQSFLPIRSGIAN